MVHGPVSVCHHSFSRVSGSNFVRVLCKVNVLVAMSFFTCANAGVFSVVISPLPLRSMAEFQWHFQTGSAFLVCLTLQTKDKRDAKIVPIETLSESAWIAISLMGVQIQDLAMPASYSAGSRVSAPPPIHHLHSDLASLSSRSMPAIHMLHTYHTQGFSPYLGLYCRVEPGNPSHSL